GDLLASHRELDLPTARVGEFAGLLHAVDLAKVGDDPALTEIDRVLLLDVDVEGRSRHAPRPARLVPQLVEPADAPQRRFPFDVRREQRKEAVTVARPHGRRQRVEEDACDCEVFDAHAAMRDSRWSPTRSEFAIAVSAGFTAPMAGKMLVSTT